jgi:hypothetical protein
VKFLYVTLQSVFWHEGECTQNEGLLFSRNKTSDQYAKVILTPLVRELTEEKMHDSPLSLREWKVVLEEKLLIFED